MKLNSIFQASILLIRSKNYAPVTKINNNKINQHEHVHVLYHRNRPASWSILTTTIKRATMSVTQVMGHLNFTALFISTVSNFIAIPSPRNTPEKKQQSLTSSEVQVSCTDWLREIWLAGCVESHISAAIYTGASRVQWWVNSERHVHKHYTYTHCMVTAT